MTLFYISGGALAGWAVLVAFLGITRDGFPSSKATETLVAAISVVLVAAAIGAAIVTGGNESDEEGVAGEGTTLAFPA